MSTGLILPSVPGIGKPAWNSICEIPHARVNVVLPPWFAPVRISILPGLSHILTSFVTTMFCKALIPVSCRIRIAKLASYMSLTINTLSSAGAGVGKHTGKPLSSKLRASLLPPI